MGSGHPINFLSPLRDLERVSRYPPVLVWEEENREECQLRVVGEYEPSIEKRCWCESIVLVEQVIIEAQCHHTVLYSEQWSQAHGKLGTRCRHFHARRHRTIRHDIPTNGLSKLKVRSDYPTGLHFWNNQLTCISSSLSSTTEVLNLGHDASQGFVMNGPEHSMLRQGECSSEERPQRGCFLERPLQPLTALTCPAY